MDHIDDRILVEKLRLTAESEESTMLKILLNLAANRIEQLGE